MVKVRQLVKFAFASETKAHITHQEAWINEAREWQISAGWISTSKKFRFACAALIELTYIVNETKVLCT